MTTHMVTDPEVVEEVWDDAGEVYAILYRRAGRYYQKGGTGARMIWLYSFTLNRRAPYDGKNHRFFREKDVRSLPRFLEKVGKRIEDLHSVETPPEVQE